MPRCELECPPSWSEVEPRDVGELLVEREGALQHLRSDFSCLHDFGQVGPVDCPAAYDPVEQKAFRYVCESQALRSDFSEIRSYSLKTGATSTALKLSVRHWVLWLLEWIPEKAGAGGQLLGLSASDQANEEQVVIQHRLFLFDPDNPQPRFRPLCRDAYKPLAFSPRRGEFVFSGAEGTHIVGLNGNRISQLGPDRLARARGASFHPNGEACVALGGEGIHLWHYDEGRFERLTRQGRLPVWSKDGGGLWYAESSSELCSYDFETRTSQKLVSLRPNRLPDYWNARPARQSACGRYLAVSLSAKQLRGVTSKAGGISKTEKVFDQVNSFCLMDLERREFWQTGGAFVNAFYWV